MRTVRLFNLVRSEDKSGVSGTGVVAEGVEFSDGSCVMRWLSDKTSTAIYASVERLISIHGHEGATRVQYADSMVFDDEHGQWWLTDSPVDVVN